MALLIPILTLFSMYLVIAQTTPEILISWKASNFVPASYLGKIYPTKDSIVEVGVDLLNGNTLIDLSKVEVGWFLDGRFLNSGVGLKHIRFQTTKGNNNDHALRVTLLYQGNDLGQSITIPIVSPEVVIDTASPTNAINIPTITFRGLPYFFNVQDIQKLNFQWSVNNETIAGNKDNPDFLKLQIPTVAKNKPLSLSLSIFNQLNSLEFGSRVLNILPQ